MRALLRAISIVLLLSFGGTAPLGIAASFAEICCDGCEDEAGEHGDNHEQDCDCPLGCVSCCSPAARAVVSQTRTLLTAPEIAPTQLLSAIVALPPDGIARDILKVPKRAG